jgi:hypothetical protein
MINKDKVKETVTEKVRELMDILDAEGSLEHFDIKIKHSSGEVYAEKTSKHKFKIKV